MPLEGTEATDKKQHHTDTNIREDHTHPNLVR